jgi:beta-lactam-binding protein with PASTA domain
VSWWPWRRRRRAVVAEEPPARRAERVEEVEAGPPPPPPDRHIWPWLLLLLLVVLGGLAAVYLLTRDDGDERQVPSVVGLTQLQAEARIRDEELRPTSALVDSERPRGLVARQRPEAGTELDVGDRVFLFISRGPLTVAVPRLVGLSRAEAERRLTSARLRVQARNVFARQARGIVVGQDPRAGVEVRRGTLVVLNISRGQQRVAVPDVVGRTSEEAATILARLGLSPNAVRVPAPEPPGTVVAQNPQPGTRVVTGARVRINVAEGAGATTPTTTTPSPTPPPAASAVPNVVGQGQVQGARAVEQAGYQADSYPVPSSQPRGRIVSQQPAGGTRARRGSIVRLNVSFGAGERPLRAVPDVGGQDEQSARDQLRQIGFTVRTVYESTTNAGEQGIVLSQEPEAGQRVPAGTQIVLTVGRR